MPPPRPNAQFPASTRFGVFPLGREIARAGAAFGLYLLLYPLWNWSRLHDLYARFLAGFGEAVVRLARHFRWNPEIGSPSLGEMHSQIILIVALFLVSFRIPWKPRLRLFGTLLGVAFLMDLAAAALTIQLRVAKTAFEQKHMLLLLPREFNAVEYLWYIVYVIPLQAGPFVLLALTALANGGFVDWDARGRGARNGWRSKKRLALVGSCVVFGLAVAMLTWLRARESDPLHVRSHVRAGNLLFEEGDPIRAQREYRTAIRAGSSDGDAWYRLALILKLQGDDVGAGQVLRRGLAVVGDSRWREMIMRAGPGSEDPSRDSRPGIILVEKPIVSDPE